VRRILLGGTFDPPHIAHLVAGETAYRQLGGDLVTFVPAGAPWQKAGRDVSDAGDRWAMTQLATVDVDYFEADDREVRRDGWTYTIETLEGFADGDELILVLGADAAAGLPTWHRGGEVLERARIAVAPRPGTDRLAVEEAVGSSLMWLDMPLLELSGTEIRARAAAGGSIRFLVPERVWGYANERRLYTQGASGSPGV
jgi:nicotinate-nucleotide adenylyltransferase